MLFAEGSEAFKACAWYQIPRFGPRPPESKEEAALHENEIQISY